MILGQSNQAGDVPRILYSAVDVFLLPSRPGGGAPIALIWVQAAALPCIVSEDVPRSSVVLPQLVSQPNLEAGGEEWVRASDRASAASNAVPRDVALRVVDELDFSIRANYQTLCGIYSAAH